MNPITTNIPTIVTPQAHLASKYNFVITAILFAQEANKGQFYVAPTTPAPTADIAVRGEAQFHDSTSAVFMNAQFAETIKALTGESIRNFAANVGQINWKVGMVVRAVNPQYRTRTDDGYTVGNIYLVTNETSGRARGSDNLDKQYLNSTHGYGVKPMSKLNDEWELVDDQVQIEALVTMLTEKLGSKFVDGLLADDGKSLLWVAEKLAK